MNFDDKMLALKTMITNAAKDFFMNNDIPAKPAYIIMQAVCGEFQKAVIDEIVQSGVSIEEPPATIQE